MKTVSFSTLAALMILAASGAAHAAAPTPITFAKGKAAATLTGHIKGAETVDYQLHGHKGQRVHAKLEAKSDYAYFDVAPAGSDERIFIGTRVGTEWTGALPGDGDYKVHVYFAGYGVAKGEQTDYTLTVELLDP